MTRGKIEHNIIGLIREAVKELALTHHISSLPAVYLEIPREKGHGDLSSSIAMKLSGQLKLSSRDLAARIVDKVGKQIEKSPLKTKVEKVEVRGPGFINFFLTKECLYDVLADIKKGGARFGRSSRGRKDKLQIEFVSANPTGPLSVAHGRQAAVGDSLAMILLFSGYRVTREYYVNDEGRQMDLLGESIRARYLELLKPDSAPAFPKEGYQGRYIYTIAQALIDRYGRGLTGRPLSFFSAYGCEVILKTIKKDLKDFGVIFDVYTNQSELGKRGRIKKALDALKKKGFLYEKDGALWFCSSKFGDDKDRVVVKSDGSFTYIAPDIAYHKAKYERGFKRIINIWGPDHHGYIPRIKAAVSSMGYPNDTLSILIIQLATLYKGGRPIPMSTRVGEFITLRQVIDEVGKDAARFFFLMRKRDSHLDFDLELAKSQSLDNPVYYIQYAHARICSILKYAKAESSKLCTRGRGSYTLSLLREVEELTLLKLLRQFPNIIRTSARDLEPYKLIPYLQDLASAFHGFYTKHKVVTDNKPLSKARLLLVDCTRIVLANGLRLLGVSTPAKM